MLTPADVLNTAVTGYAEYQLAHQYAFTRGFLAVASSITTATTPSCLTTVKAYLADQAPTNLLTHADALALSLQLNDEMSAIGQ